MDAPSMLVRLATRRLNDRLPEGPLVVARRTVALGAGRSCRSVACAHENSARPLGRLEGGHRSRLLRRIGGGGKAHPFALSVCGPARGEAFTVARAVAAHDTPKFVPVDGSDLPVLRRLVVRKLPGRNHQADRFRLCNGEIGETVAQLVVAFSLDSPAH